MEIKNFSNIIFGISSEYNNYSFHNRTYTFKNKKLEEEIKESLNSVYCEIINLLKKYHLTRKISKTLDVRCDLLTFQKSRIVEERNLFYEISCEISKLEKKVNKLKNFLKFVYELPNVLFKKIKENKHLVLPLTTSRDEIYSVESVLININGLSSKWGFYINIPLKFIYRKDIRKFNESLDDIDIKFVSFLFRLNNLMGILYLKNNTQFEGLCKFLEKKDKKFRNSFFGVKSPQISLQRNIRSKRTYLVKGNLSLLTYFLKMNNISFSKINQKNISISYNVIKNYVDELNNMISYIYDINKACKNNLFSQKIKDFLSYLTVLGL